MDFLKNKILPMSKRSLKKKIKDLQKDVDDLKNENVDLRKKNEGQLMTLEDLRKVNEDRDKAVEYLLKVNVKDNEDIEKAVENVRTVFEDQEKRYEDLKKVIEERTEGDLQKHRDHLLCQLECPVCLETCLPPIKMCLNGHNVCSRCVEDVKVCPTCRAPDKPSSRNMLADHIIALYGGQCENRKLGCMVFVKQCEMKEHLLDCEYRYRCVQYQGDMPGLLRNFSFIIASNYSEGKEWEGSTEAHTRTHKRFISCFECLFICTTVLQMDRLYIYVRHIALLKNADKYKCRFTFFSEDKQFFSMHLVRCHYTYIPFNIKDSVVIDSYICKKVIGGDGTIRYKIDVEEYEEKSENLPSV